jgi:hypothetical protein
MRTYLLIAALALMTVWATGCVIIDADRIESRTPTTVRSEECVIRPGVTRGSASDRRLGAADTETVLVTLPNKTTWDQVRQNSGGQAVPSIDQTPDLLQFCRDADACATNRTPRLSAERSEASGRRMKPASVLSWFDLRQGQDDKRDDRAPQNVSRTPDTTGVTSGVYMAAGMVNPCLCVFGRNGTWVGTRSKKWGQAPRPVKRRSDRSGAAELGLKGPSGDGTCGTGGAVSLHSHLRSCRLCWPLA